MKMFFFCIDVNSRLRVVPRADRPEVHNDGNDEYDIITFLISFFFNLPLVMDN